MYQLYYYPNNASLAPHFLLHHTQSDYNLVLVDTELNKHKSSDYLTINPAGRIPTLIDGDTFIFESAAICVHLCEKNPEYALIPPIGDKYRPLFFQWLMYLTNTLQADLMIRYYPHYHTTDKNSIASIVAAQENRIAEALAILDAHLENKEFLVGDNITACDFFLFMLSEWALPIKKSPISFKNLARYLKQLSSHPTIEAVCDLEGIDLKPFLSSQ